MEKTEKITVLRTQMNNLRNAFAETYLLVQGTITERTLCRKPGKSKTYGPYYQWTFKKNGKTVTVNLSAEQAGVFRKAIDDNRKIESALKSIRGLSREILELSTTGVSRRK